jgi:hypothetical protein
MPDKFCLFCGKKPDIKTKEHILPKWLIKLTGDPNRKALFPLLGNAENTFTFSKFTFPSCKLCNHKFGKLEELAKIVVSKMLRSENIKALEIEILMDWMDKIRIGIWLAQYARDGEKYDFEPKFYIQQRIGEKDRALYIAFTKQKTKRLNFLPSIDPYFIYSPCFMGIYINGIAIISISQEFIISQATNLPYYSIEKILEIGGVEPKFHVNPTGNITLPSLGDKYRLFVQGKYYHELNINEIKTISDRDKFKTNYSETKILYLKKQSFEIYPDYPSNEWIPKGTPTRDLLYYNLWSNLIKLRKWLWENQKKYKEYWAKNYPKFLEALEIAIKMYDNMPKFSKVGSDRRFFLESNKAIIDLKQEKKK